MLMEAEASIEALFVRSHRCFSAANSLSRNWLAEVRNGPLTWMVTAQNRRSMFAATNFIRFFFVDFVAIGPERFTCHTHSGLRSEAQAAITLSARLLRTSRIRYPFRR